MTGYTMFRAELDLGQILIIVVFVVASFVQWLWKLIQQGREERTRRRQGAPPVDEEEKGLREEAWRRQVAEVPQRPPPTATPPPLNDPWTSVRDVFERLKEERRREQEQGYPPEPSPPPPRPSPPPLPRPQFQPAAPVPGVPPEQVRRAIRLPSPMSAAASAVAAISEEPVSSPATTVLPAFPTPSPLPGLRSLLRRPESLRQAILIREILGPPKALQSAADTPL